MVFYIRESNAKNYGKCVTNCDNVEHMFVRLFVWPCVVHRDTQSLALSAWKRSKIKNKRVRSSTTI